MGVIDNYYFTNAKGKTYKLQAGRKAETSFSGLGSMAVNMAKFIYGSFLTSLLTWTDIGLPR